MNYDELALLVPAFQALPEQFKNSGTLFAVMQNKVFIAHSCLVPMYFDNNEWHKVPVVTGYEENTFKAPGV